MRKKSGDLSWDLYIGPLWAFGFFGPMPSNTTDGSLRNIWGSFGTYLSDILLIPSQKSSNNPHHTHLPLPPTHLLLQWLGIPVVHKQLSNVCNGGPVVCIATVSSVPRESPSTDRTLIQSGRIPVGCPDRPKISEQGFGGKNTIPLAVYCYPDY